MNSSHQEPSLLFEAFASAPIAMALLNRQGKPLKVNRAFCNYIGYTEEELLQKEHLTITHPDDLQSDLDCIRKLYEQRIRFFQKEKRFIHKEGHTLYALLYISLVQNNQEEPAFSIAQIIDKTKDMETEKVLDRLDSLYKYTSEGIGIFDLEGRILQVNPAFERIFGYKEEELMGKRLPVTPEFSMDDAEYLVRETLSGRLITDFETIKQRKDGELIAVTITMSPIRDDTGRIYALSGIVRDVTEKKRNGNELRATKLHLESFISNNLDPIFIFNADDCLVRVNPAAESTFGWSAEELLGKHVHDIPLIPEEYRFEVNRNTKAVKSRMDVHSYETIRYKKDKQPVNVMLSMFPLSNNGWAAIIRDINERKQAEEVLLKSEKLSIAGQLAAGVAHEIRNPVTAIKGFMQLMQGGMGKPAYLDIMSEEIQRIELILSELLILAKPQVIRFERKDIRSILAHVIALLEAQAHLNNIEISLLAEEADTLVYCDENQMKQVFINFIKNAIEAMPNGGQLHIEAGRWNGEHIRVLLIDQGTGIPKHILAQLGQPFYTTKEKGTGLGFMVSSRIIENHHGSVHVYSEENQGTTVELLLPAAE